MRKGPVFLKGPVFQKGQGPLNRPSDLTAVVFLKGQGPLNRPSDLTAVLGHRRRSRVRRTEADLDVARQVVLNGVITRCGACHTERADSGGHNQLHLAECTAGRHYRLAQVTEHTRSRHETGGDSGAVRVTSRRPLGYGEGARARSGVVRIHLGSAISNRDKIAIISIHLAGTSLEGSHLYTPSLEKNYECRTKFGNQV